MSLTTVRYISPVKLLVFRAQFSRWLAHHTVDPYTCRAGLIRPKPRVKSCLPLSQRTLKFCWKSIADFPKSLSVPLSSLRTEQRGNFLTRARLSCSPCFWWAPSLSQHTCTMSPFDHSLTKYTVVNFFPKWKHIMVGFLCEIQTT